MAWSRMGSGDGVWRGWGSRSVGWRGTMSWGRRVGKRRSRSKVRCRRGISSYRSSRINIRLCWNISGGLSGGKRRFYCRRDVSSSLCWSIGQSRRGIVRSWRRGSDWDKGWYRGWCMRSDQCTWGRWEGSERS